ncbi:MAG: FAD-dependent monooxygenase [Lautropia sp.]
MTCVLIVGAGPTGLTLGIELRRFGADVRLIERLPQRVLASKGKGLQPRTLEVFDTLGVIGPVMAESANYPVIRAYAGGARRVDPAEQRRDLRAAVQ